MNRIGSTVYNRSGWLTPRPRRAGRAVCGREALPNEHHGATSSSGL